MIEYTCPKCGHVMQCICLTSYPPQTRYECFSCGYVSKTVSEPLERYPLPNELQQDDSYHPILDAMVNGVNTAYTEDYFAAQAELDKATSAYVRNISTDTGVNFYDLIEPEDPDTD